VDYQVVPLNIGEGREILVEVRTETSGEQDVGVLPDLSFDSVVDSIEAITQKLTAALATARPDSATLEFGIDVGLEAGQLTALLVKGSGTATVKITLVWEGTTPDGADG
jgi:Trypsin-co-occurring domain 1